MDHQTEALLERWEDYCRAHPNTSVEGFLEGVEADIEQDVVARFRDFVEKLKRMDQRLEQIGVESRDTG